MNAELVQLIADQEHDDRYGHRIYPRSGQVSFDAAGSVVPKPRRVRSHVQPLSAEDSRHGTHNGYNNHRCRCERCRKANTEYMRGYMRRRRARILAQSY